MIHNIIHVFLYQMSGTTSMSNMLFLIKICKPNTWYNVTKTHSWLLHWLQIGPNTADIQFKILSIFKGGNIVIVTCVHGHI